MRKYILLPGLALAGGAAGFCLRRLQLTTAYDPDTYLFLPGDLSTAGLLALTAALAALFLLLVQGGSSAEDFLPAFRCPSPLGMTMMTTAAFLLAAAGVLGLMQGEDLRTLLFNGPTQMSQLLIQKLSSLLCFPAGLALLLMGRAGYRGQLSTAVGLLATLPAFAALTWMFFTHLENSTDPILMHYVFSLGAATLLMLAHYYFVGFLFDHCCPRRALFTALLGVSAAITSLADRPNRFTAVLTVAMALSALTQSVVLLRNLFGPPWPERMPRGADAEDEDDEDDVIEL